MMFHTILQESSAMVQILAAKKKSLETGSGNEGSIQLSHEKHPLTYHGILFVFY